MDKLEHILETIIRLEKIKNPSKELKDIIKTSKDAIQNEASTNILNLISIGRKIGWDDIEDQLHSALALINGMKETEEASKKKPTRKKTVKK